MCGIVGVIQYESKVDRAIRQRALKILFSETMLKTEPRGRDATGLYQVHTDGDWAMTKKGQKVTDWIFQDRSDPKNEDPVVYSDFMDSWLEHPHELTALVGHCRAATVGTKGKDNNDNHPFAVQLDERNALLGIHNGTLNNHEEIFKKLPKVLTRHGSVDSEAIFHFLYHLTDQGQVPVTGDMLRYMGERLEGAYAVIAVNSRFPNQVVTFRKDRPMECFMIAPLNVVVIASEKKFVESALDKYAFIRQFVDTELPALKKTDRTLVERDYRIFDSSLEFPNFPNLTWNDFDKVSETGKMTTAAQAVLPEWKGPASSKSSTGSSYSYSGASKGSTGTGTGTGTAAKSGASPAAKSTAATTAKASKKDTGDDSALVVDGTVVEVEIGSEDEAKKGMERAKSLGVCVHYDDVREIAEQLGVTPEELKKMKAVEVANKLSQLHFTMGFAAARLESKAEVDDIRKKGREVTAKLEKAAEKQKRAQNHIWEHRQLVQILIALHDGGYKFDTKNVGIVLTAFPSLSKSRKKDILAAAKQLLEGSETEQLVRDLRKRFKEAEGRQRSQGSEGETS